ncbi:hypothetical protein E4U58_000213 [Claviceps cyperi]|nr:hypothetical protein E4U58_000213 [Claviceps cyperi]
MSTVMMLRPYACAPAALDLWLIAEDSVDQRQTPFSTPVSIVDAKADLCPMYPGLQTPKMDRTPSRDSLFLDPRPRHLSVTRSDYARPRKSLQVQEPPVRCRRRTSSRDCRLSGYFPNDSPYPPLGRMSYVPIRTPPILKNHRNSRTPLGGQCSALPGEVLDVILEMLKEIHLDQGSGGCATCWMRDVSSVALCSRKWYKAARLALYQDIQLTGPDIAAHKKKFRLPKHCRLALLRRTLRADADIASTVRSLRVPTPEIHTVALSSSDPKAQAVLEQYEDQIASLVIACPNLERLSGPVFTYDHSFKRLFQALATRGNLEDMDWVLDAAPTSLPSIQPQQHATGFIAKDNRYDGLVPHRSQLQPHQEDIFLKHHKAWTKLTSLSIQCLPGAPLTQTLLSKTLSLLPSLQHLHLHDLPRSAFTDDNLAALPPLKSLTLSNIRGISSSGLSAFATRPNSQPLRELTLRHTPLTSLSALARILSNLHSLTSLSFVQSFSPLMPDSDSFVLCMMPYLASSSITKLHWDITSHHPSIKPADDILAQSIAAGGFPSLRLLRAPNDPDGLFQTLCRPIARIALPGDRLRHRCTSISDFEKTPSLSSSASRSVSAASPPKFLVTSSTTSSLPSIEAPVPHTHSSLASARLAAQARLDRARQAPRIQVNVTDEHGNLVERFGLAGYLGTLGSPIEYHLLPDLGSTDEQGGLAGWRAGEDFPNRQTRGCVGCEVRLGRGIGARKNEGGWWCAARRWRGFCDD